jgi:hypothetical protein
MTIVEYRWSALPVPCAVEMLDRISKQRYVEMPVVEIDC